MRSIELAHQQAVHPSEGELDEAEVLLHQVGAGLASILAVSSLSLKTIR